MKTRTKALYGALFTILVMATPIAASAKPWGHGPGYMNGQGMGHGWYQSIPQEKQQAFSAMMQAHRDKMRPIQEQIWAKQTTLQALSGNPKVDPKDLTSLVNEISSLRNQAYAERKSFADRVQAETGFNMPYGMGGYGMHGNGMGGYGHRGQRGGHNGGYGGGCGW